MNFVDLQAQYQSIKTDMNAAIQKVLDHGRFIMGPEIAELEAQLAAYVGVKHCIGVASGTDAILVALMALDLQPGDEVITTPFTFIATGEVIRLLGLVPVFVDIEPDTYNIDPQQITAAITDRTRVIMPVSLYGQPANMTAINPIADAHGLVVIEDAAQSFGATHHGRRSCGLSTIGVTSFFPAKPLGCYGDGGACFTNDDELALIMRQIRVHGQEKRYQHCRIGVNARLDTLQAAILLEKFKIYPQEVIARQAAAQRYHELLSGFVQTATIAPDNASVFAQYTIEVEQRDLVRAKLQETGIPTAVHYPKPLHLQEAFADLNKGLGSYPIAEAKAQRVLSLPMHPYLSYEEQASVAHAIEQAVMVAA